MELVICILFWAFVLGGGVAVIHSMNISRKWKLILIFIATYAVLFILCTSAYLYVGGRNGVSLGIISILNTNPLAINQTWSRGDVIAIFAGVGVFLAPISVIFGFDTWKHQKFGERRIAIIESMHGKLSELYDYTSVFRVRETTGLSIQEGNNNDIADKFTSGFESRYNILRVEVFLSSIYYRDTELDKLIGLLNDLVNVEVEMYNSFMSLVDGNGDINLSNLYLVSPYHRIFKYALIVEPKEKEEFERRVKEKFIKLFDDFLCYLEDLLKKELNR